MSEEPTRSQKRSRCDPAAAPPYGYHFEGQPAQMIDGMVTLRLRRNVEGPRSITYNDLYFEEKIGEQGVKFCCCVSGCNEKVSMYVKPNGVVVFENFMKHLKKKHVEYLFACDSPVRERRVTTSPTSHIATAPIGEPRSAQRFFHSTEYKLREKILECTAKVVAHGPFPLNFIQNPAVESFLQELGVTYEGFKYPSRATVTRRVDNFLDHESTEQVCKFVESVDFFCAGWDEWSSKQNINYMSLNLTTIPPDFSRLVNFMVACSKFPYPHEMPDIRKKVLQLIRRVLPGHEDAEVTDPFTGELSIVVLNKLKGLTYDGASANYCFSPNPKAAGIDANERMLRKAVNKKFEKQAEMRCLCHRIVKTLEHSYNDSGDEASDIFKEIMEAIYALLNLIGSSQKNEQELRRVQEADHGRVGPVKGDVGVPKTRWSYNARRLRRAKELMKYAILMESQTAITDAQKVEWAQKKISFETNMGTMIYILPILERFETWITYLQNASTPTMSLVLYIMEDLIQIADDLAAKADAAGNREAEMVLSRVHAELVEDFAEDLNDDYLKLAQLLDPRVADRTKPYTAFEVDRLLRLSVKYFDDNNTGADDDEDDVFDAPGNSLNAEFTAFKFHMKKVKVLLPAVEGEERACQYYGAVDRREDIDIFAFYQDILPQIPRLATAARTILAHQPANIDNERVFNIAGHVLTLRRCSLTPERAEKLVLSAFRYRCESRSEKPPRLPSFATFDNRNVIAEDDEEDDIEIARQIAEDWSVWEE